MSGFFSLSRDTLNKGKYFNPKGYKIGLELMVRCDCKNIIEVPITFQERTAGESKLTMKQNILYAQHLIYLYSFKYPLLMILLLLFIIISIIIFSYIFYIFIYLEYLN